MLTKTEFEDANLFRNKPFTYGAIRFGWNPPYFSTTFSV